VGWRERREAAAVKRRAEVVQHEEEEGRARFLRTVDLGELSVQSDCCFIASIDCLRVMLL
jgi:hypothetical protein